MGESGACKEVTAIRSALLDTLCVKETSKDREEEDEREKFLIKSMFKGQKRKQFDLRLQRGCPNVESKVS